MAWLSFVSGGCRSGKSDYALKKAYEFSQLNLGEPVFLATCPKIDSEMDQRILRHQGARDPMIWRTIEEAYDLQSAITSLAGERNVKSVVLDCLSLWVNNLMYRSPSIAEAEIEQECEAVLKACKDLEGSVHFVSSEVGLGLVPGSGESRRYRDLLGLANQIFARDADEAIFLVSGLPLKLK
ncbi:MAG: bifunctional adenosylcobinamide kinase/adenosylcobinamide-phosphate guanylyltransferase [Bdellovibrionia bacterium]